MKLNKLKTVDKIMESKFPVGLLERLVMLDNHLILLERASGDTPDEDEQVVIVQDILQHAGAVIAEFREVWAVYDEPEPFLEAEDIKDKPPIPEEEMEEFLEEMEAAADLNDTMDKKEKEAEDDEEVQSKTD